MNRYLANLPAGCVPASAAQVRTPAVAVPSLARACISPGGVERADEPLSGAGQTVDLAGCVLGRARRSTRLGSVQECTCGVAAICCHPTRARLRVRLSAVAQTTDADRHQRGEVMIRTLNAEAAQTLTELFEDAGKR